MRSLLADRLGVLVPQIVHLPPDVASLDAAQEAIELADAYGVCDGHPLDESQRFTLTAGLGERADGSWAAATVADFEARQNGKNDTLAARELAGLLLFGERLIIHTAHEFPTANESFLRLVALFENWDELRRKVARIRFANGEQGIELVSGQRLKYRARTGGSGRGFAKADLVVYDEAQHLQAEHVAASGPARLANPNNQSWYMGSGGLSSSLNAWRMRRRALTGGGGRFAYVEHTAEKVSVVDGRIVSGRPDPLDREAWAEANPAYGRRITDEALQSLYDEMGPELFARECLCVWDPEPGRDDGVISVDDWAACFDPLSKPGGTLGFAVDVSPDGKSAAIAVSDGIHVEITSRDGVLDHRPGVGWVPDRLVELKARWQFREIWLDPSGPAGALLPALAACGVPVREVPSREHAQACQAFLDSATGRTLLRHIGQRPLNEAVVGADRRYTSDAWLWSRRNSKVDISPLVAVTVALHAARTYATGTEPGVVDLSDFDEEDDE